MTERFNLIARLEVAVSDEQHAWAGCRTRSRSSPAPARASASRTRERFLAEGAKVVVAEIDEERAAGAMKALEGQGRRRCSCRPTSPTETRRRHCVDATVEAFGTVDILVNNAALYYDIDNFDPSYEYLQKVFAVNQHGAWLMARAAAPVMAKQHYGRDHQPVVGRGVRVHRSRRSATSSPGSATTATRSRSGASSASRSSWPRSSASATSRSTASRPASR